LAEADWITDMSGLSEAFIAKHEKLTGLPNVVVSPTFAGSALVGGTDADLAIDGLLVEIRTTFSPGDDNTQFFQRLLSHVLLHFNDEFRLKAVGIYFSRQSTLIQWPISTFLGSMAGAPVQLPVARERFKEALARP